MITKLCQILLIPALIKLEVTRPWINNVKPKRLYFKPQFLLINKGKSWKKKDTGIQEKTLKAFWGLFVFSLFWFENLLIYQNISELYVKVKVALDLDLGLTKKTNKKFSTDSFFRSHSQLTASFWTSWTWRDREMLSSGEYRPLIGQYWSRDLNTGLWLVIS